MAVTIVGTLEMIYTSGGDVISEPLPLDMASPTDQPLPLDTGLVFTDPAVDIRDTLEAYLADMYGMASITRVGTPRSGALAEWTAALPDTTSVAIVLWQSLPLKQVGIEWDTVGAGSFESVAIGAESEADGRQAVAVGAYTKSSSLRTTAIGALAEAGGSASNSIGYYATTNAGDTYVTEIAANRLRVMRRLPSRVASASASTLELSTSTGSLQSIGVTASSITLNGVPISTGAASWGMITGTLSSQSDLSTALAGKASTSHNHDGVYSPASHTHLWAHITDKPATFPPITHYHSFNSITGKPATFPPDVHTHPIADINATGTPSSLNFLRGDGIWALPENTTYGEITEAEITTGTSAISRAISGRRAQFIVDKARTGVALASSLALVATSGDYNDLANKPTLGTAAAMASTAFATAAQGAKADTAVQPAGLTKAAVGLGNVDNTSDANKPVSTATQTALDGKANTTHTHVATTDLTATGTKSSATYLRGDNTWNTPPNTTYTEITSAEITTGTASTARAISGRRAQDIVNKARTDLETTTQLNARDTANRSRANHTGNQAINTITNLQEILDGKPLVVDVGNRATAVGVDAQAVGASSFAAGDTAIAGGVNSIAIGVDSDAMGMESTAIGQGATSSAVFSTAVGRNATAVETDATAVGNNAQSTAHSTVSVGKSARSEGAESLSIGAQSNARGEGSAAIGTYSFVSSSHPRAVSIGYSRLSFAPDTTAIAAKSLVIQPYILADTLTSTLQLADDTGTLHTISVDATKGLMYDTFRVVPPAPRRGVQSLSSTRTTAGDIDFTATIDPLGTVPGSKVTGLKPSTVYQVTTTAMIAANSASSGAWRVVVKFPTGGTEALSGFTLSAVSAIGLETWQWTGELTSNAAGEISAHPSIRWVSGSVTSSRAEIILRVEPT